MTIYSLGENHDATILSESLPTIQLETNQEGLILLPANQSKILSHVCYERDRFRHNTKIEIEMRCLDCRGLKWSRIITSVLR
jgi:hypothetical protein